MWVFWWYPRKFILNSRVSKRQCIIVVRILQRNRTSSVCGYTEIYFKKLVHAIVKAQYIQNVQGRLAGWRPEGELQFESKAVCWQNSSLLRVVSFVPVRPLTDWMRPTHFMEDNLLYLPSTNLNINLIQKHLHRSNQNNVWANIWTQWPCQVDT